MAGFGFGPCCCCKAALGSLVINTYDGNNLTGLYDLRNFLDLPNGTSITIGSLLATRVVGFPFCWDTKKDRLFSMYVPNNFDFYFRDQSWCSGETKPDVNLRPQIAANGSLGLHHWVWDASINKIRGTQWHAPLQYGVGNFTAPNQWTYELDPTIPAIQNIQPVNHKQEWDIFLPFWISAIEYRHMTGDGHVIWNAPNTRHDITFFGGPYFDPFHTGYNDSPFPDRVSGAAMLVQAYPEHQKPRPDSPSAQYGITYPPAISVYVGTSDLTDSDPPGAIVFKRGMDRYWDVVQNFPSNLSVTGLNGDQALSFTGQFSEVFDDVLYPNYGIPAGYTMDSSGNFYYLIRYVDGQGGWLPGWFSVGMRLYKYDAGHELIGWQDINIDGQPVGYWKDGLACIDDVLFFSCVKDAQQRLCAVDTQDFGDEDGEVFGYWNVITGYIGQMDTTFDIED